jgi:outer membrane receptor protein involved in Fe transport
VLVRGLVTATTAADGTYRLPALQPGKYQLTVELSGFLTKTLADVAVSLEQEVLLNVTLGVGGVAESVTVTGQAQTVDLSRAGSRERITPETIESMPLNGRQFLDLIQLVPGTAPRPPDVQEGSGVTVLGGRSTTNGFLIDGLQNKDNRTGGFKEFFIQDAIQEFNVNIAGFQPEYGLASGAVVNIITKSGTNDWSGRVFVFGRSDALDSSNVAGQPPPELLRSNVGGTLGGPLAKSKSWFFYAVENLHETRGTNLDMSQVPPIILSGFATPSFGGKEPFGNKPITRRLTQFAKVNQRINASNQFFVAGNWNHTSDDLLVQPPGIGFIYPPSGSLSLPSTASNVRADVFSVSARETAFLANNRGLLESSLHYVHGTSNENTSLGGGSTDEISLLTNNGRFWNTNYPLDGAQLLQDSRLEWAEDLSFFNGGHSTKFGFHVDRLATTGFYRTPKLNIIANTVVESRYQELGMDLTNQQGISELLPVNGRTGYDIHDTVLSAYAQDDWSVASNIKINAGLRWDYETLFGGSKTNIGPRLGVTWDPWKNGKTVFRASGGIFFDAGLLGPALMAPELGGSTIGSFDYWDLPRGGAFFDNPALNAFGALQAGGTRWLANPTLYSYLMPAGDHLSSGGISITGQGDPYIIYQTLGITVPNPASPPILNATSIPQLTGGRYSAQQALDLLNARFPSPLGFPQFFYVPAEFAGQVMKEGTLAFKFRTADVQQTEIQSIERPFKTPYTVSFNFGFERELMAGLSVDIEYFHRDGNDLLARRVANLLDTPISSSCLGNTTDGQPCNRQLQPIGFSRVNALTVALRKRLEHGTSFQLSYTYTHAIDNFNTLNESGGSGNFDLNNQPNLDIGRSLNTPVHVLVVSGVYQAPAAIQLSSVLHVTSGRPFNATGDPVDSDGDGNLDDRLITTTKGAFLTDKFVQLDLRIARPFHLTRKTQLTVLGEVFNLLNRANPDQVSTFFDSSIGKTIVPLPGREWQFGIRFEF